MEKSAELKPGDKVYHKSLTNVIWVIDKIENGEAYCSSLNKETLEKKTQSFALTSIEKVNDYIGPTVIIPRHSDNRY